MPASKLIHLALEDWQFNLEPSCGEDAVGRDAGSGLKQIWPKRDCQLTSTQFRFGTQISWGRAEATSSLPSSFLPSDLPQKWPRRQKQKRKFTLEVEASLRVPLWRLQRFGMPKITTTTGPGSGSGSDFGSGWKEQTKLKLTFLAMFIVSLAFFRGLYQRGFVLWKKNRNRKLKKIK